MNKQQQNGIERLFVEFAEECGKNPNLNQAVQELKESVFTASQDAGVDPSHPSASSSGI